MAPKPAEPGVISTPARYPAKVTRPYDHRRERWRLCSRDRLAVGVEWRSIVWAHPPGPTGCRPCGHGREILTMTGQKACDPGPEPRQRFAGRGDHPERSRRCSRRHWLRSGGKTGGEDHGEQQGNEDETTTRAMHAGLLARRR